MLDCEYAFSLNSNANIKRKRRLILVIFMKLVFIDANRDANMRL